MFLLSKSYRGTKCLPDKAAVAEVMSHASAWTYGVQTVFAAAGVLTKPFRVVHALVVCADAGPMQYQLAILVNDVIVSEFAVMVVATQTGIYGREISMPLAAAGAKLGLQCAATSGSQHCDVTLEYVEG